MLVDAVRGLDDAGVVIDDIALGRPTLDDVFLALTGHAAEESEDSAGKGRKAVAVGRTARTPRVPRTRTRRADMAVTTASRAGSPVPIARPLYGWALHDGMVTTRRYMLQTWRVPEMVFYGLVQPVVFLVLFAYVFGGAIGLGPPGPVPTRRCTGSSWCPGSSCRTWRSPSWDRRSASRPTWAAASWTGSGRCRWRRPPSCRGGPSPSSYAASMLILVVMVVGLAIGWRIHNGFWSWLGAVGLMLLFGYALSWVGSWVGLGMPNEEVASTAGLIWIFPLTFISSAFVPIAGMPTWLQPFAQWNPISTLAHSCRELFGNPVGIVGSSFPEQHPVLVTVIWCVALLALFVPLSVRRYKRQQGR